MPLRICIDCRHTYHGKASRCPTCQREWARRRNQASPQYRGNYPRLAAIIRATPAPCWICGEWDKPDDPWQADHVTATELRRAHRSCNARRGTTNPVFGTSR